MDYTIGKIESVDEYLEKYKEDVYEIVKEGVKSGALYFIPYKAMEKAVELGKLIVARSDEDHVIGFVYFNHRRDKMTRVYDNCVSSKCRGMGVGKQLYNTLIEEARSIGQEEITVLVVKGIAAHGFFQSIGFSNIETLPGKHRELIKYHKQIAPKQQGDLFHAQVTDTQEHQS